MARCSGDQQRPSLPWPVLKGNRLQNVALTDRSVAQIVKYYAELVGLDPEHSAGHSLRAGYVTSAVEAQPIENAELP